MVSSYDLLSVDIERKESAGSLSPKEFWLSRFGAFSQFYMTAYGDINPCDFNPISFGNVLQFPIQAIWNRMVNHPDFKHRHMTCRMQTQAYREKYIDHLPDKPALPIPIEEIDGRWEKVSSLLTAD